MQFFYKGCIKEPKKWNEVTWIVIMQEWKRQGEKETYLPLFCRFHRFRCTLTLNDDKTMIGMTQQLV